VLRKSFIVETIQSIAALRRKMATIDRRKRCSFKDDSRQTAAHWLRLIRDGAARPPPERRQASGTRPPTAR